MLSAATRFKLRRRRAWRALLKGNEKREGGPWVEAAAELDRETKREAGDNQHGGHAGPALPKGATRAPEGTRDGVRRRLEKYAKDSAACKEKGTTAERVKKALVCSLEPQVPAAGFSPLTLPTRNLGPR